MNGNGKGSKPRPLSISKEEFDKRYEKIFPSKEVFDKSDDVNKFLEELREILSSNDIDDDSEIDEVDDSLNV